MAMKNEEIKLMFELYSQGLNDAEIAKRLDYSQTTIFRRRKKYLLASSEKRRMWHRLSLYLLGMTDSEIANATDCDVRNIRQWRHNHGFPVNKKVKQNACL